MFDLNFYKNLINCIDNIENKRPNKYASIHKKVILQRSQSTIHENFLYSYNMYADSNYQGLINYLLDYFKYFNIYDKFMKQIDIYTNQHIYEG